ncbi:MAG: hypothetical protein AB1595_00490, partial [bacterium]
PITILIIVGMFKYNIGRFINSLVDIFEKRGGEIKIPGGGGIMIPGRPSEIEEEYKKEEKDVL